MVTPFSFSEGTARAFRPAGVLVFACGGVVVSITDGFVFFVDWGAGLVALPVLAGAGFPDGFATGLLTAAFVATATFLTAGFEGLIAFAGAFALVAGAGFLLAAATFLLAAAPFAGDLDLATALGFALLTALGFALTTALGLALAAFAAGFALALAAGLARAADLADLAPALGF